MLGLSLSTVGFLGGRSVAPVAAGVASLLRATRVSARPLSPLRSRLALIPTIETGGEFRGGSLMSIARVRRSSSRIAGVAGGAAVALTIALTSPGVQIARAAEPAASFEPAGLVSIDPVLVRRAEGLRAPSCSAPGQVGISDEALAQELSLLVQQQAGRLRALATSTVAHDGHVVMNSRGYNYPRQPRTTSY
jgi:hypothetical protein